ncbi:MAG: helix-turn-helix domain-containing protein [Burkholderiales bacterium]
MDLKEFVEEIGGQTEMARRLGVTQGLVWQWLNGRSPVTWERAKDIEALSNGRVSRHDLRPDIFGPAPSAERVA